VGWLVGALLLIGLFHGLAHMRARRRRNCLRERLSKARLDLGRALHDYPPYDPPHKVEERRLPKEKAAENFDYFMRVRMQRVAQFRNWLQQHFAVRVTHDEEGVRALGRWGNDYAGWLLGRAADGHPQSSDTHYHAYYAYDPPWTGENAGMNVVFDMGITLGEAITRQDFQGYLAKRPGARSAQAARANGAAGVSKICRCGVRRRGRWHGRRATSLVSR
jgi:hypothetical protein